MYLLYSDSLHVPYYVHVELQNHHYNPIIVEYRQAGVKDAHALEMRASYHKWFNLVLLKPLNYPMSIEFKAYDDAYHTRLNINHQISVLYQPRYKRDSLSLSVGDTGKMFNFLLFFIFIYRFAPTFALFILLAIFSFAHSSNSWRSKNS